MLYTPHIRSGLQHLEDLAHFLSTQVVDEVLVILTRSWRAIQPLNLIRNAAARLIFNLHMFSHKTPLLYSFFL